jgi:hypothetical protein
VHADPTTLPVAIMRVRRFRCAIEQIVDPFAWDAYVVVCAFATAGHRIRFSNHPVKESEHG